MEFKVIKRNGNAVVPDGMFKLCGMEDVKLISMVQLNGGILLMPESVEQHEIRVGSMELYAHLWQAVDWDIQTEQERFEQEQTGGMTLAQSM